MAFSDVARILAELDFSDKLSPGVKKATESLGGLQKSTRQTELEIAKLGLAQEQAAAKAAGSLTKQQKAVFAQRKATLDAEIAQEKYNQALSKQAQSTVAAEAASGRLATTTSRLSQVQGALTAGVKVFGGIAAAGFGLAAKGALELDDVQAELQRSTGLTADAARDATKALNGIAGENVTNINDVAAAFEKVHNDLGLTGQAATDTTRAFVEFGRATAQGPSDAVAAFDDILDAWNLTADQSRGIMDQLVVSHQKYGGSIDENERALATLAPQLKALNVDTNGAIALLNLFAASGIDASKATFALNTAVQKLKPGQGLDDLIRQVAAIEDPTQRAQKAIELFGARGGVALANVLRPGINGLSDFAVSATDAAGATQRASDAIDSSVRGQLAKAVSVAGAAIRGFGADFGPALTGLASLSTLIASVSPGLGGKLAGALTTAIGDLGGGKVRTAADALGKSLGVRIGAGILVGIAVGAAGLAEVIGEMTDFRTAQDELVSQAGLSRVEALAVQLSKMTDAARNAALAHGALNAFTQAGVGYADALASAQAKLAASTSTATTQTDAAATSTDALAASAQAAAPAIAGVADAASTAGPEVYARMQQAAAGVGSLAGTAPELDAWAKSVRDALFEPIDGARQMRSGLDGEFAQVLDDFDHFKSNTGRIAQITGELMGTKFQKALHSKRPEVRQEAEGVQLDALAEIQKLVDAGGKVGKKGMQALRDGMHSKNQTIRDAATEIYNTVVGHLPKHKDGSDAGKTTGEGVHDGLQSKDQRVANAAKHLRDLITANLPSSISTTIDIKFRYPGSKSGYAAEGGYLRRPGDKLFVGEMGETELAEMLPDRSVKITPLHKLTASQASGLDYSRVPNRSAPTLTPTVATREPWPWPYGPPRPYIVPMPDNRERPLRVESLIQAIVTTRSVVTGLAQSKAYGSIGGVATPALPGQ